MPRYPSIDILRGLAILLMILVHFVENLSPRDNSSGWLYDACIIPGGLPAPFFAFVSGLSYELWVRKQEGLHRPDSEITVITLRRGLFLFGLGIAFNFFLWLPEETFNWDILTLIGTALLFLAFARNLPPVILGLLCLMVILASPLLRVVGDYPAYWTDHTYSYDFNFRDILFGFVANGFFPVFPWILFPILGFLAGDLLFGRKPAKDATLWRFGIAGLGLLAVSGLAVTFGASLPPQISRHYANGLTEFPASTEYVLATTGLIFLSLVLLHRWVDQFGGLHNGWWITALNRFSSFSLTVYVLHHMVILWPLWISGASMGHQDPTYYWRQAMNTPIALGLALVFMAICHFVLIGLEKYKRCSLEALFRWICD